MANPINIPPELWAEIARMLRDYRAGNLTNRPADSAKPHTSVDACRIVITGNAGGGGKYLAKVLQPGTNDIGESGNVSEAEFGTQYTPSATGAKVLALNMAEKGKATHTVAAGSIFDARIVRRNIYNTILAVSFNPGGSSIPNPTAIYQVYTPVDSTLTPVWTSARFE
jgi:hypothetical protein